MEKKMIRVPVDIDEATFWKLAAVAEHYDMKVPEYIRELAATAGGRTRHVDTDPIAMRWRQGLTDAQIARELGLTNIAVAVRRRSYQFPANKKKKEIT